MSIKSEHIGFKLTSDEKKTISDCAAIAGLPLSEYVRRSCLVPVDLARKALFADMHRQTEKIYDEWSQVLDTMSELIKDERKSLTPNKRREDKKTA